ncbi:MAG: outer membrane protein transport protein [Campylobacteraceae bacterium]|jgi:long-chain fatty acid transport protein|nr:outer membrane protein transport protein [Campylobacteraceae bacterium]
MRVVDKHGSFNLQKAVLRTSAALIISAAYMQASGYKIPEQSLSGLALGAANVAAVNGADASYYNPANMVFLTNPESELEFLLTYVNLPHMTYTDNSTSRNGHSKVERFAAPLFHFVTPKYYENWRLGFSMIVPGGLAKRWDTPYQAASAKKFSLKIIEANPTAAYKINDWASIGFGVRAVYSTGEVASDANGLGQPVKMDMEGDSFDFGYNLALSFRPVEALSLAATYRSKVNLTLEGDADLAYAIYSYSGDASVSVPLPAVLDLAVAYTFAKKTTVEFVYERVYWSAYEGINFDFPNESGNTATNYFGQPKDKHWRDSNTFRLGITHLATENLKLMAGFAIDKTPAPEDTLAFELPDSNSKNYSAGFEYKINQDMSIGMAYLFSDKEKRDVKNSVPPAGLNGKFTDGGAHLVNMSFKYRF